MRQGLGGRGWWQAGWEADAYHHTAQDVQLLKRLGVKQYRRGPGGCSRFGISHPG